MGISGNTLRRFIRLTELIPELLQAVDNDEIAVTTGAMLSYLPKELQRIVWETMHAKRVKLPLAKARRMKELHEKGKLDERTTLAILTDEGPPPQEIITFALEEVQS